MRSSSDLCLISLFFLRIDRFDAVCRWLGAVDPSLALSCRRPGLPPRRSARRPPSPALSGRHLSPARACNPVAFPSRPREAWANWGALSHFFLCIMWCLLLASHHTSP